MMKHPFTHADTTTLILLSLPSSGTRGRPQLLEVKA